MFTEKVYPSLISTWLKPCCKIWESSKLQGWFKDWKICLTERDLIGSIYLAHQSQA